MMKEQPYLTFSLNQSLYGIDSFLVEEIFFLPEVTPIPEAPQDIVGVVNIRGTILPIMDLNIRFGYREMNYHLTDSIVVLKSQDYRIGIIVNQVHEVRNISNEQITQELSYGRDKKQQKKHDFVAGIARSQKEILIVLDVENLVQYVEKQNLDTSQDSLEGNASERYLTDRNLLDKKIFCPNATSEERAIFRQRAEGLSISSDSQEIAGLKPLAIVVLNGEFFGVDLNRVREFTDVKKVTPIPCCPGYIIGNMNLRGEILTLIDIRGLLNLPLNSIAEGYKAMVVDVEGVISGITVEEVFDVMFLNPKDITSIPTAIHAINDEYLQGAASYKEKMMSILDLEKIFTKGELLVNEIV